MKRPPLPRDDDPTASLFVYLSCSILDDWDVAELDILPRLIFMWSMPMAMRANKDGLVSQRAIWRSLQPFVTVGEVEDAVNQLVGRGLFDPTDNPDLLQVRSWLKYHPSSSQKSAVKSKQSEAGHRTNHGKGLHDEKPNAECPLCDSGSGGGSGAVPESGSAPPSDRPGESGERAREVEVDLDPDPELDPDVDGPSSSTATPKAQAVDKAGDDDDTTEDAAQRILNGLQIVDLRPNEGDRASIDAAMRRGWTVEMLEARAFVAAGQNEPLRYLRKTLTNCINETPPTDERPTGAVDERPWHERRFGNILDEDPEDNHEGATT